MLAGVADPARRQAILTTALAFVGEGATAREIVLRLADEGVIVTVPRAAEMLAALAARGLVRVGSSYGTEHRYVTTSLGRRMGDAFGATAELHPRLEELERLRSDLFAAVAHELRTPLTAIRTSVGVLLDPALRPSVAERERLLQNIAHGADRMQRLVADVLDLARFRAGAVRLQLRPFDAAALADEVAATSRPLYAERAQHIAVDAPERPVEVYGDRRRLEQVLLNLLSNASKFSPDGAEIRLAIACADADVTWSVKDPGAGIREEDRPRLFERFFTTDRRTDRGGAGLGLPISLAIAEAHGGTIEVESKPDHGSTFRLRVPRSGPLEDEL